MSTGTRRSSLRKKNWRWKIVWRSLYKHGEGLKLLYIISDQEELKFYHTCGVGGWDQGCGQQLVESGAVESWHGSGVKGSSHPCTKGHQFLHFWTLYNTVKYCTCFPFCRLKINHGMELWNVCLFLGLSAWLGIGMVVSRISYLLLTPLVMKERVVLGQARRQSKLCATCYNVFHG